MSISLRIDLNPNLYLRNPQDTDLGHRIIKHSIELIEKIGFESFTFKKLARKIGSTEASVYRYFENKHLLLTYLINWYWEWLNFKIEFNTLNIYNKENRLKIAIKAIVETGQNSPSVEFIDQEKLHQILISEGSKAYHTKDIDEENKKGFFLSYKQLVKNLSNIILEVNPEFKYPKAMASNILEMANNHLYFAEHLPGLTDINIQKNNLEEAIDMIEYFVFKMLKI